MVGNPRLKPPSFSLASSSSTASPDQPKDPNTPTGFVRTSGSRRIAPSAAFTGVGICPPSVGEPIMKPSVRRTSASTCPPG